MTSLPEGNYFLTHLADPENHWLEDPNVGETNNFTWLKFRLSRKGRNPEVTVLDSPCISRLASGPVCGTHGNP